MLGQENDLPDVVSVMGQLPVYGLDDSVRFAADSDGFGKVSFGQRLHVVEQCSPSAFPSPHQQLASVARRLKFHIAVAVRLLAVGREEVAPPRIKVAGDVLDHNGDGIRFGVDGGEEFGVTNLIDRLFGQAFVITERRNCIGTVIGNDFVHHVLSKSASSMCAFAICNAAKMSSAKLFAPADSTKPLSSIT